MIYLSCSYCTCYSFNSLLNLVSCVLTAYRNCKKWRFIIKLQRTLAAFVELAFKLKENERQRVISSGNKSLNCGNKMWLWIPQMYTLCMCGTINVDLCAPRFFYHCLFNLQCKDSDYLRNKLPVIIILKVIPKHNILKISQCRR